MRLTAQRIEQRPPPTVDRGEARREGGAVTGGGAQRSARLTADADSFTTNRAQPRSQPSTTPQPAQTQQPKKKGGGIGGFFRGVGRAIGGAARTVGRALTGAARAVGHGVAAAARFVGHYAGYPVGVVKGLVEAGLYKLGLGGPAKYPTNATELAQEERRIQQRFGEAVSRLPASPKKMLQDMRAMGLSDVDIFHGSHVVVEDGGRTADTWQQLPGARPRTSSHYGGGPPQQYEMNFPDVGVVLFGKTPDGNTFFQMEAHSNNDTVNHTADFILHKLSGNQNVGPAGVSPHSEKEGKELHVAPPPGGES